MHSPDGTPKGVGCPIRTSTDQRPLAAPRGFSQRATSFVASWCQGIHRVPFSRSTHPPRAGTIHAPHNTGTHGPPPRGGTTQLGTHTPGTSPMCPHSHAPEHSRRTRRGAVTGPFGPSRPPGQTKHRARRRTHDGPHPTPHARTKRARGRGHPSCPARPGTHQNPIHLSKEHGRTHSATRKAQRRAPPQTRGDRRRPISHKARPNTGPGTRHIGAPTPRVKGPKPPRDDGARTRRTHTGWRRPGSNRRPPACKAGALPAELRPRTAPGEPDPRGGMGQGGFEPPTPRLSSVCSNRLSY